MQGLVEVKEYGSAAEMIAAAAAVHRRLFNPPKRSAPKLLDVQIKSGPIRLWTKEHDAHVKAFQLDCQLRRVEMNGNRMVADVPKDAPAMKAFEVTNAILDRCAARGEGKFTLDEIRSPRRYRELVHVRHQCMAAVIVACPMMSYPQMGQFFHRDHTSLLHAARKFGLRQ